MGLGTTPMAMATININRTVTALKIGEWSFFYVPSVIYEVFWIGFGT